MDSALQGERRRFPRGTRPSSSRERHTRASPQELSHRLPAPRTRPSLERPFSADTRRRQGPPGPSRGSVWFRTVLSFLASASQLQDEMEQPFPQERPLHVYAPRPASSRLRGERPRVLLREVFGCIGVRLSAALFSGMSLRHRAVTPSLLGGGRSAPQVPTGALPGVPAPRVYFIAERPRRTVDPRGGTVGQASASPAVRPAEPPPPPRVPALPPRSTSPLGWEPGHREAFSLRKPGRATTWPWRRGRVCVRRQVTALPDAPSSGSHSTWPSSTP